MGDNQCFQARQIISAMETTRVEQEKLCISCDKTKSQQIMNLRQRQNLRCKEKEMQDINSNVLTNKDFAWLGLLI